MGRLRHDLVSLWDTRHTSGFPWPTWRGSGGGIHMAVFGYPRWAAIPLWRQALGIPLRPWRYLKRVRGIARARGENYSPYYYDSEA